jgi:hypothetical protein
MKEGNDWERDRAESEYRAGVLKSLLVASMASNDSEFPSSEESILSAVVNATIRYAGGNAGAVRFRDYLGKRPGEFEREMYEYLEREAAPRSEGMDPNIWDAIRKLVDWDVAHPTGPGDGEGACELYDHFDGFFGIGGICPSKQYPTFILPSNLVSSVEEDIMPRFSGEEERDIIRIGMAMRLYIEDDLKGTTKHYTE